MKKENRYRQMQETLIDWMGKVQENLAEKMGDWGEVKSNKEQMAAFKALTPSDWVQLMKEREPSEINEFIADMLRREAQSDAHRKPI